MRITFSEVQKSCDILHMDLIRR